MKNKLVLHQIALIGVLLFLSIWKLFTGGMIFGADMIWWWLGAILGFVIVFADRLVYVLLMNEEPLSRKFGDMFSKGHYLNSMEALLSERHEQKELVMRSALFILVWVILALFAATSVGNPFARGFVLGIGTHLIFDLISDYTGDRRRLGMWFWQVKRELPENEKSVFVWVMAVAYIFLAFTL